MKILKKITMSLVLAMSIICFSPLFKPSSAVTLQDLQPQPNVVGVCSVHGSSHYTSSQIATQAVVKETGEFIQLVRVKCDCGTYLWYEGYPSWGITRYFYGDPNYMQTYVDALNRTVFKVSASSIYNGNPSNWVF